MKGPGRRKVWGLEFVLWESGFSHSITSLFPCGCRAPPCSAQVHLLPSPAALPRAPRHSHCLIFSTSEGLSSLTQQDLDCLAQGRLMLDS